MTIMFDRKKIMIEAKWGTTKNHKTGCHQRK